MQDQRSSISANTSPTARDDQHTQAAVLTHVVALHPAPITISELLREIAADPADFPSRDDVERAVRDLADIGLLHRHDFLRRPDALVLPSRAALTAYALWLGDEC